MKNKNILSVFSFLLVLMFSISVSATSNITIDFESIPDFYGASCTNNNHYLTTSTSSSYSSTLDTNLILNPLGDSCLIPQNQTDYDIYSLYSVVRITSSYRGRFWNEFFTYKNASQDGLFLGTNAGACNNQLGFYVPSLVVDFGEERTLDTTSLVTYTFDNNPYACSGGINTVGGLVLLDSDGEIVKTYGNSYIETNGGGTGTSRDQIVFDNSFSNTFTSSTDGENVTYNVTFNEETSFQYMILYFRNGQAYTSSVEFKNITITNISDPCADLNDYDNTSIQTLLYDDYFNYSVSYFCNNWDGSLENNLASGFLSFNDTSNLDFMQHSFLADDVVSVEFDLTLDNLNSFAFSLFDNTQAPAPFLQNVFINGNDLYVDGNSVYSGVTTSDNFSFKVQFFGTSGNYNLWFYKNGVSVYNGNAIDSYNATPNSIYFYENEADASFNVTNLVIYSGTSKDFDNSLVSENIQTIELENTDHASIIENKIDELGFKSDSSRLVLALILILLFIGYIIYEGANQDAPTSYIWGVALFGGVTLFIVFYTLGFIPFWVIFLIGLITFAYISLKISGANGGY